MSVDIDFFDPEVVLAKNREETGCNNCHRYETVDQPLVRIPGDVDFDFCPPCLEQMINGLHTARLACIEESLRIGTGDIVKEEEEDTEP